MGHWCEQVAVWAETNRIELGSKDPNNRVLEPKYYNINTNKLFSYYAATALFAGQRRTYTLPTVTTALLVSVSWLTGLCVWYAHTVSDSTSYCHEQFSASSIFPSPGSR